MVTKVKAIYEKGAVYLLEPVDWPEHAELEISVQATEPNRLGRLLKELSAIALTGPEDEPRRERLRDLIRDEMYRDRSDVGTADEELEKLLGFDPNDEEKMAELAEKQHWARQEFIAQVKQWPPLASLDVEDEDLLIYS